MVVPLGKLYFQVQQIDESRCLEVHPGDNSLTVRLVEIPSTAVCSQLEHTI